MGIFTKLTNAISGKLPPRAAENVEAVKILREVGFFDRKRLLALGKHMRTSGPGTGSSIATQNDVNPLGAAIIDDEGQLSWGELHSMSNALAHRLKALGVKPGDGVALFIRNSRWFTIADCAANRCGARILYMNTGFAGPQFAEVLEREGAVACIYDGEFEAVVAAGIGDRPRLIAFPEGEPQAETMAEAIAASPRTDHEKPSEPGGQIILTSGTTGTPKGANRGELSGDLVTLASIFSRIPYRADSTMMIAAPMFHAWGLAHQTLALPLGATLVLRRKFDPEATMRLVAEHRCDSMAAVPVMLQRILALPEDVRASFDTSSLKVVASSGSALPGSVATQWMDAFGDNLYNMFGSTEVAMATIATPADMRAAPGTAGKPPIGSVVKLYDDDGKPITTPNTTGRIFVGNSVQFEGYTGGGDKEKIDGLMSIGDLGHFDEEGRLFVGGRDDDMIVSGGENLFPSEVENLLIDHPDIVDVAVIGVDDEEFGKRLAAFIVLGQGKSLSEREVKDYVKSNLANYKVPRDITFIDELPRNQSGKILKRELRSD